MSRLLIFLVLFGVCCIHTAMGALAFGKIETEFTEFGTKMKYCSYEGMKYSVRSKFKDLDNCMDCRCTKKGLRCSSMAYTMRVLEEDAKCINVVDGCRNRWVLKNEITKKCPKKSIPKKISLVGK